MADAPLYELVSPADALASRTAQTNICYALVFNGSSWDQVREATADGMSATGIETAGLMGYNGATWDRVRVANTGRLQVDVVTGGGGSQTDASTWTTAVTGFAPIGGVFNDSATALTSGQQGTVRLSAERRLLTSITTTRIPTQDADTDVWAGLRTSDGYNTPLIIRPTAYNGSTWDRLRTIGAMDAAPNADTGVQAVGIGPGWDRKQNPAALGTATNSAITLNVDGADSVTFWLGTTTTGTIIFETTGGDSGDASWATAASCVLLGAADLWIGGAVIPAAGNIYMVRTTGFRSVRVRTASTLGATVTVKWTGSTGPAIIKTMDMAPQPHAFGQAVLNYQSASLGVTTSSAIIALTSGKRVYITSVRISTGGTTAGAVALYSAASGAFTEGTSTTLFYGEFAPSATIKPGVVLNFAVPWSDVTAGNAILLTTTGLTATHVQIQYYVA